MKNNKLKRLKLIKRIFLFTLALALTNCQNDESSTNQEQSKIKTVNINEAKSFLKGSTNNPLAKSANSKLDNLEFDKATLEKINGSNELLTVIPFATNDEFRNDRVLLVKIEDEIKSVIFSMQPEVNSVNGLFSGKIIIYSLEGDFINGYGAKDGIIEVQYLKDIPKTSSTSKPGDGDNNGVVIWNNYRKPVNATDWDMIWGSGGSSMGWSPVGGTSGMSWDALGSGGGSSSGITAPSMVQIIDALIGKAKCINDQLNKKGNSFVQNILNNFEGKSEFNFEIVSKEEVISKQTNLEVNGTTNYTPGSYLMTIEISTSKANENSALETARVILHEYIHAEMFRKLNTINDAKKNEVVDFKTTYNAYEKEKDHAAMAKLYINSMKEALKEFHEKVLVDDYKKYIEYYGVPPSDDFYEAFAWGGLRENDVKPWLDLSESRKKEIIALASRAKNFSKMVPCSN